MDIESTSIVAAVVVAIVAAIKEQFATVSGNFTILIAAIVGGVLGALHVGGLDILSGVVAGLGAVGVHTVVSSAGGK